VPALAVLGHALARPRQQLRQHLLVHPARALVGQCLLGLARHCGDDSCGYACEIEHGELVSQEPAERTHHPEARDLAPTTQVAHPQLGGVAGNEGAIEVEKGRYLHDKNVRCRVSM
jgi:hypothetical protein